MEKFKVVIAASPRPLVRVIEHLLSSHQELQIVSRSSRLSHLLTYACYLLPELIIVNTRLMGREIDQTIAEIKRLSPKSKLILICPFKELSQTVRRSGADADLQEDALVTGLSPLVRKVIPELSPNSVIGARRETSARREKQIERNSK